MTKNQFLTAEQERKLIRAGQRGDLEARNKVIMNIYYLIARTVSRKVCLRGHYDDAINHVIGVLCDKFHKFDLKKNVRYVTYAMWWVHQALQRFVDHNALISVPESLLRPCNKQTARGLKFGEDALRARRVASLSPDNPDDGIRFKEQLVSREREPFDQLYDDDDISTLKRLLNSLDERERVVITRRTRGDKLREIGSDLGLTRERVRQIEFTTKEKLRELARKSLGDYCKN